MAFVPSVYQQAIFDWIENDNGNAFVDAVAGSGKTTTLVQGSRLVNPDDAIFLAFNKAIVEELRKRLDPFFTVSTLNALGHNALAKGLNLKRLTLNARKYSDLLFDAIKDMVPKESVGETLRIAKDLVSFSQSNLGDGSDESLLEIMDHYAIELPSKLSELDTFNLVRSTLNTGEAMAKKGIISFDDQIWLPVKWGFTPPQSKFVMVDEAQDMSKAKCELALSAVAPGGRILGVGDPRQSIYGFAGADARAVPNFIARTNAKILPLSVSYRCPIAIVEHAKKIVPHIEAAPGAIQGEVATIKEEQLFERVTANDLVLSRVTAPLISLCIKLIKRRIPATVKGRDIGSQLVSLAKDVLGNRSFDELHNALDEYMAGQLPVLMKRRNPESIIAALVDKIDGVKAVADGFKSKTMFEFSASVEAIFADKSAVVQLSTIHRAKGLDGVNIYIISPSKLPLRWKNQRAWESEQESNLDYVARTRAKNGLYYVQEEPQAA